MDNNSLEKNEKTIKEQTAIEDAELTQKMSNYHITEGSSELKEFKELKELISVTNFPKGEEEKYINFLRWVLENGGYISKTHFTFYSSTNRGILARENISNNETFIKIPQKIIISEKLGAETEIGKKIIDKQINFRYKGISYMAIFLMRERANPNSFWKPFLNVLPTNLEHIPYFYSEYFLKKIRNSPLYDRVIRERNYLKLEYEQISNYAKEMLDYPLQEYEKCMFLLISRGFDTDFNNIVQSIVVPYADMFNFYHEIGHQTEWHFDESSKEFVIRANQPILKGNPISEFYGARTFYNFLYYFGFVEEATRKSKIFLKFQFQNDLPFLKEKLEFIKLDEKNEIELPFLNEDNLKNFHSFNVLRFLLLKEDVSIFKKYKVNPNIKKNKNRLNFPVPIFFQIELEVLNLIEKASQEKIKGYNLEELNTNDFNETNIKILIQSEVKTLKMILHTIEIAKKILNKQFISDNELKQISEEKEMYHSYISSLYTAISNKK